MKRIVILGAGFGGLRTALQISKKLKRLRLQDRYEVALVDRNEHHTYTPLLYEVATTSKESANIHELHNIATFNIRGVLRGSGVRFMQDEVTAIDPIKGTVELNGNMTLAADYLVLALGSESNFFGIPGLQEHALPLKTMTDAVRIRDTVWNIAMQKDHREIRVLVGGGGPSGVELAGELKTWFRELTPQFACSFKVTIVEAGMTVMNGFPQSIVSRTRSRLMKIGVELMENQRIMNVDPGKVKLQGGKELPYDVLIWTGGVKASTLVSKTSVKCEPHGRVEVAQHLACLPQTPDLKLGCSVYGIGDSICFYDPVTKAPTPGTARAALSQASVVAHNVIEDIKAEQGLGTINRKMYRPFNYPYVTPIGGKYAIARVGPFVFSGFFAWVFKGLIEFNYLLSIMPAGKAFVIWITGLYVFIQNDRLG